MFQGHIETIFDCKFKPDNPNLLATASFDGTIKVWDINTLEPVSILPGKKKTMDEKLSNKSLLFLRYSFI